METPLVDALLAGTGAKTMTLRTWGRIPPARFAAMIPTLQIQEDDAAEARGLTPIEEGQVTEVGNILQMLAGTRPSTAIAAGGAGATGSAGAPGEAVGRADAPGTEAPQRVPGPLARYCHRSDPCVCTEPQAGTRPRPIPAGVSARGEVYAHGKTTPPTYMQTPRACNRSGHGDLGRSMHAGGRM